MTEFFKFAVMWFVFMGIIAVISLITPKLAPKVERIFKSFKKKEIKNPYNISDEAVGIEAASEENTKENEGTEEEQA